MGGWVGLRNGWVGGFKEWVDEFINIKVMYNNDVGKGGVWAYAAHEVK
jgi:hypothetical protein